MRKVFLRAEANHQIGWGHVSRMQALGQMLLGHFDVNLVTHSKVENEEIRVILLSKESDFFNLLNEESIVVLDGYDFDIQYQQEIKNKGAALVCIDDYQHTSYLGDLIINHAPGVRKEQIKAQGHSDYLLGPQYALLRPPFLEKFERVASKNLRVGLIFFGGSDVLDLSNSWARRILKMSGIQSVNVILGNDYRGKCLEINDTRLHIYKKLDAIEMRSTIRESDFAIVSSSTILLECLSQQMPCASGFYTDNQKFIYEGFLSNKLIVGLGDLIEGEVDMHEVIDNLSKSIQVSDLRSIFDGKSTERILAHFLSL